MVGLKYIVTEYWAKTNDVEITVNVHAQRIRVGESRVEMQSAKWAAEGTVKGWRLQSKLSILWREAYVSCRKYEGISQRVRFKP